MLGCRLLSSSRAQPATVQHQIQLAAHQQPRQAGRPAQGASPSHLAARRCHDAHRRSLTCCSSKHGSGEQHDTDAAHSSDRSSSSGGSGAGGSSPRQRSPKRRGKTGRRREDYAFVISRSDLTWEQPWMFDQSASLRELRLREQGLAALDDAAAAAPEQAPATATWRVQLPTGLGALVVDGTVTVSLPLRCEFCGEPFERALQAVPFDAVVYLGDSGSELAANELLFEMDQGFVDLTPVVCDSLLGSLPTVCLCGGASCAQHAGKEVGWTAPAAAPAAASSPFAKLLAAKGGAGGSNGSGSGKKGKRR